MRYGSYVPAMKVADRFSTSGRDSLALKAALSTKVMRGGCHLAQAKNGLFEIVEDLGACAPGEAMVPSPVKFGQKRRVSARQLGGMR